MDRLFLDANVLFSAAYRPEGRLLRLWKLDDVSLVSSRYALEEARFNLSGEDQQERLAELSENIELFDAANLEIPRGIVLPAKDPPILRAAIEAHSTHLLTGDIRHFGPYFGRKIAGILVDSPGNYLKMRNR
jgi:predicted nucleic acid-binding protein